MSQLHRHKPPLRDWVDTQETSSSEDSGRGYKETEKHQLTSHVFIVRPLLRSQKAAYHLQAELCVCGCTVPVEGRRVAGHEEEDIWLQTVGVSADVTKCLEVAHDIQSPSLVNQAGVQSGNQVGHQQDGCCHSTPCFQMSQRYPCGKKKNV